MTVDDRHALRDATRNAVDESLSRLERSQRIGLTTGHAWIAVYALRSLRGAASVQAVGNEKGA